MLLECLQVNIILIAMQAHTGNNLAKMLSDFANLHSSGQAIARMQAKWPDLLPDTPQHPFKVEYRTESGETLAIDVPENLHWVLWLRDLIRQLWTGNPNDVTVRELEQILLTGRLGVGAFVPMFAPAAMPGIIVIDWKHRRFDYRPKTVLQRALYCLLQNSPRAKICANPDCPAPYFIAPRSNTRYCSEDCLQAIQRKAKLDWWNEKGEDWRKARQKKSRSKK